MIDLDGNRIKEEPDLLFDDSDTSATSKVPYWGLRNFGPYTKETDVIRLGIISPVGKVKEIENLINDLNQGTSIFPGGMPQFFRCKINVEKVLTTKSDNDVKEYEDATQNFIKTTDCRKIDAVLVYTAKTSKYLTNTPYYRLKALFTSNGFPTQIITETTLGNIKYSYLNLASALFAKAGYTPWVLQDEMKSIDMILGVSVSNVVSSKNRAGTALRFVGYANVFDTYGKWMFFEGIGQPYKKEEKANQLKSLVSSAVTKFTATKPKVTPKNIAIHHWKRFSRDEIEIIEKTLNTAVGDHNTIYITIDDSQPFRMYETESDDGSFPRGHYAYLGDWGILLSTTGTTDISGHRMGTPKLLHITYSQKPKEFLAPDDIAQQIFSLTKLNWASATPLVREPVSLLFSRKIAYLTATMSDPTWAGIVSSEVSATLNNRTWFI